MHVFVGSTTEQKAALDVVVSILSGKNLTPRPWLRSVDPGKIILPELMKIANEVDLAVFILTPDDNIELRKSKLAAPRDNLIFEAGLFMSTLGSERVMLLVPESFHSMRLPSDFGGLAHVTYRDVHGGKLQEANASELEEILTAPCAHIATLANRLGPRESPFAPSSASLPIYPHPDASPQEWFALFRTHVERPNDPFPPRLLYGGPGSAKFWRELVDTPAFRERRNSFPDEIRRAVQASLTNLPKNTPITVVDLGIGTLDPGTDVHRIISDDIGFKRTNYIAVDISIEMLLYATAYLRRLRREAGTVHGINCDFFDLVGVRDLIPKGGRRIFLLLGNTLGNESDPLRLMSSIRRVMDRDDRLIIELQLMSKAPPNPNTFHNFYTGPFLYAGYSPEDLERNVNLVETGTDQEALFVVKPKTRREFRHPLFARPIEIDNQPYTTHFVRKFSTKTIKDLAAQSDFRIIHPAEADIPEDQPTSKDRRYLCVVLARPTSHNSA